MSYRKRDTDMNTTSSDHRSIEIDFDIHKLIEKERLSFSETPNQVLRRLLGLSDLKHANVNIQPERQQEKAWSWKGVTLPSGTELRMEYNGKQHIAFVKNGEWLVDGVAYTSPSAAAGAIARTKSGQKTSLDGWIYWNFRRPGETRFTRISSLRT
jgi:hypothetical protein